MPKITSQIVVLRKINISLHNDLMKSYGQSGNVTIRVGFPIFYISENADIKIIGHFALLLCVSINK
jgi:hypothetical protein